MTTPAVLDDDSAPWFTTLCGQLGRDPDSAECEAWAHAHPDDPQAQLALAEAGHGLDRRGEPEQALALYEQAYALRPAGAGWLVACIAGQLFTLGRVDQARDCIQELRQLLDLHPEDDAFAYAEMADLLDESGEPEAALEWCEQGIARYYADYRPDEAEPDVLANRLFGIRRDVRERLEYVPDEHDLAVDVRTAQALAQLSSLIQAIRDDEDEDHEPREAFNGLAVYWPPDDFLAARERWPQATAVYGDDYVQYCRRIEGTARQLSASGAARVVLVCGSMADYEAYALRTGEDPAQMDTRTSYGTYQAEHHPEATVPWPPPRNGSCWCGSGTKYKKCCGDPRNRTAPS